MFPIPYELVFDTSLLVSTASSGRYDRTTALDRGLPYVPVSTLRGRVKEMIRMFLVANEVDWVRIPEFKLCDGQKAEASPIPLDARVFCTPAPLAADGGRCPLCRIFGARGLSKRGLDFGGGHYSKADADRVRAAFEGALDANLERRVRHKRNDRLRRPEPDHLFVDGAGVIFSQLHGMVRQQANHARYPEEIQRLDFRLVLLGLRLVTGLGGGTNRGYGACQVNPGVDWAQELQAFADWWSARRTVQ